MGNRLHLRKAVVLAEPGILAWTIPQPDAVAGTADEVLYNAHTVLPLSPLLPIGPHTMAVPGVRLGLDAGGSLSSSVEFWGPGIYVHGNGSPSAGTGIDGDYYIDDYNLQMWGPKASGSWVGTGPVAIPDPLPTISDVILSEAGVGALSAVAIPETLTAYDLPGAGVDDQYADGTYVGDWVAVTTPIPAGSGYLYGGTAGGASSGSVGLLDYPASVDYGMDILCRLELGDAGGNVLVSVDLSTTTFQCDLTAHSTSTVEHLINTLYPISWGAPITQQRCVAVISGMYGTQSPYGSAGISTLIGILRTS